MTQLINEPTRGVNVLDLIFTDNPECVNEVHVLDPIHDLDHCPVLGKIAINLNPTRCYPKPFTRHIFHYDNGDFVKLNSLINDVPWISVLSGDIDDMYQSFVEFISAFRCECFPNFVVKINPRDKPGMTSRIKKLFKISNRLHKKASRSKLPIDILNHRNARRFAKCEWIKGTIQLLL